MQCFFCKKNNFELVYSLKTKNIIRCKNDGLFVGEATASRRNNVYRTDYFDNPPHPPNSNRNYFLKKLEIIKLLTSNLKPHILDIGCGWGDFEEALEKEKIPYLGIDTNQEAIKICQKKGLNCKQLSLEELINFKKQQTRNKQISNNKETISKQSKKLRIGNWDLFGKLVDWNLEFDSIVMFQVIEHVKNPLPILQSARKLLKKNGIILITTPNNDSPIRKLLGPRWSVYNEPSHYVFYNKKTLEQTLKLAGFKKIDVKNDSIRYLSASYIFRRLQQMFFPTFTPVPERSSVRGTLNRALLWFMGNFSFLTFNFPIPTDPSGDLETTAVKC